ncbi:DNA_polymerase [Hexamita inflata]|uniref:DNA polymerase n=1 Tax=Hexamita inflata TaxID=28002 RepID=A0AA86UQ45_9EUKA|nr:DNA polymerase [Hexamita inflata]CAI9960071.1 DNA polymerase [Hexamita inflata]
MKYVSPRPIPPPLSGSIEFQLIDIQEIDNVFQLFGVTNAGNSIQVEVTDYEHYFYIGVDTNVVLKDYTEQLKKICENIIVTEVSELKSVYALNRQASKILKIQTKYSSQIATMRNTLKDTRQFNSDIDARTRFLTDCNGVGCGWLSVENFTTIESGCQIGLRVPFKCVKGIEKIQNAPIRTLSFDIECISREGFPQAKNENDKIITIGVCAQDRDGDQKNVVLQLGETAPLNTGHCQSFQSEQDLINNFFELILKYDPDIITGYNIDNFDFPYVFDRCAYLKIQPIQISRLKKFTCKAVEKTFQSNQMGTRESYEIHIPGRVSVDILPQIQTNYKLRSYTLNNVSSEFLGEQKDDVHYSTILPLFEKDSYGRRTIAQYCLKDAQLPIKLNNKLMIVVQLFEMSKVTGVPLLVLTKQGQQARMISLLSRYTKQNNMLIPYRQSRGQVTATTGENEGEAEELEGATVLEPKKGFYDKQNPISTLDFSSLYPSIIIAHNLCYSTLIEKNSFDLPAFNKKFGTDMTFDELINSQYVTKTPQDFYFLKTEYQLGLLPQILQQLLAARKKAKKDMANAKDDLEAKVLNGRQLALKVTANSLYGFTGALQTGKLPSAEISSSVTSFGRQMIDMTKNKVESYYVKGTTIKLPNEQEITLQKDAEVVYGDTDSVMVKFGVSFEQSFQVAVHAAALVTKEFIKPISLEFEKVYCPYLLVSKKRYAGLYWTKPEKYDKIDVKGLELVRRDNCQLVALTMKGALERLLIDGDKDSAVRFIKSVVQDLVTERIDMQLLVISKAYSQSMDNYKNASQPHLTVVTKLKERGYTVKIGDRIQYVIVRTTDKELYKRSENPQYVIQKGLAIDTDYYLHQQLENPLARLFKDILGGGDEKAAAAKLFSGMHTLFSAPKASNLPNAFCKVRKLQCIGCGNLLEDQSRSFQVCDNCLKNKTKLFEKYNKLVREMQLAEHRLGQIAYECCVCQDMEDATTQCSNQDCEVYYARFKQVIELNRCKDRFAEYQKIQWTKDE